nr:hypothetical protein [uncultured Pseudodesulfovibrio sp.]
MISQEEIELSEQEMDAVLTSKQALTVPDRTGIVRNARFSLSVKIGGKMEMVMVICKDKPYQRTLRNGRKVWVVDVFGYGVSGPVYVTKLRQRCEEAQDG